MIKGRIYFLQFHLRFLSVFFFAFLTTVLVSAKSFSKTNSDASVPEAAYETNVENSHETAYQVALALPWIAIEKSMNRLLLESPAKDLHFSIGTLQLQAQGVPVLLSDVSADLKVALQPAVFSQNRTVWKTEQLSFHVNVGGFQIKKDIVQNVGGVNVVIHFIANCDAFFLDQTLAQVQTTWEWNPDGTQIRAELKNLGLQWPANSWKVSPINCHGPTGFADVVQNEIQKQLVDPQGFKTSLMSLMQDYLNQKIAAVLMPWRTPSWIYSATESLNTQGLQIQLSGIETMNSKGLLFHGLMRWQSGQSKKEDMKTLPLVITEELTSQVQDAPTLLFSQASFQDLAQKVLTSTQVKMNLNSISAFASLMRSRFLQFFIWPDLMRYPKNSIFQMSSKVNSSVINWLGSNLKPNEIFLNAEVGSWIFSLRDQQRWNYIYLQTQMTSTVDFELKDGKMDFRFQQPKLKTRSQFFPEYLQKYHPSTYISTSIVDKAVAGSPLFQNVSVTIPSVQVAQGQVYQAQNLRKISSNYLLEWR